MQNIKLVSGEKGWFEITYINYVLTDGGNAPVWTYILLSNEEAIEVEDIISKSNDSSSVSFQFVDALQGIIQSVIVSGIPFEIIISISKENNSGRCEIAGKEEYLNELIQNHRFEGDRHDEDWGDYIKGTVEKISLTEIKNYIPQKAY